MEALSLEFQAVMCAAVIIIERIKGLVLYSLVTRRLGGGAKEKNIWCTQFMYICIIMHGLSFVHDITTRICEASTSWVSAIATLFGTLQFMHIYLSQSLLIKLCIPLYVCTSALYYSHSPSRA